MTQQLLDFNNPVLSNYAFYGTLVLLKMMLMSYLTVYWRMTKKVSELSIENNMTPNCMATTLCCVKWFFEKLYYEGQRVDVWAKLHILWIRSSYNLCIYNFGVSSVVVCLQIISVIVLVSSTLLSSRECVQVFSNPEDTVAFKVEKIILNDPDVERVRR